LFSGAAELVSISRRQSIFVGDLSVRKQSANGVDVSVIPYALAVGRNDGGIGGVLVVELNAPRVLEELDKNLSGLKQVNTWVLDEKGSELVKPANLPTESWKTQRPHDAQSILARTSGALFDTRDRPETLQVYARIHPAGQSAISWTVVDEMPLNAAMIEVTLAQGIIILISMGCLLLAIWGTRRITRAIVSPLETLALAARAIAQENYDIALPTKFDTVEVAELAQAFETMRTRQSQLMSELRHSAKMMEHTLWATNEAQRVGQVGTYITHIESEIWQSSAVLDDIFGIDATFERSIPNWISLIAPEFLELTTYHFQEAVREHKDFRLDYQIVRPCDGQVRWIADNGQIKFDSDGKPVQIIGTIQDITQRKLAEEHLMIANERLTLATKAGGVGVWDWDVVQNVLTWDEQMFTLYGLFRDSDAVSYEDWLEAIYPEDRQIVLLQSQKALRGEVEFDTEYRIVMTDKSIRNIRAMSITKFDASGKPVRMTGTNWDVTDIRTAEKELEEYRKHLEHLVEARTQAAEAAQLEAEHANQAKSTFLSNISHELRTPMHAILSYGNLGRESQNADKHKKYFDRIVDGGDRLMLLINDLLDLSKLEAGKIELNLATHDLRLILLEAVEELNILSQSRAVSIDVSNLAPALFAECDALRMGQVIRNLLSNALKFSPANSRIYLKSEFITTSNELTEAYSNVSAIAISVIDAGQGIPEPELEAIFDKFVQSSKTASKAGGTGLGLSICREIMQYHSGTICATNNNTGGATFTFTLPLTQVHPRRSP
jgi:PAS domain S-box-containing protein